MRIRPSFSEKGQNFFIELTAFVSLVLVLIKILVGRGIYTLSDANVAERYSYAEVAKRVPKSVYLPPDGPGFH